MSRFACQINKLALYSLPQFNRRLPKRVAQSLVFQRLCVFSLIDSITRERVTGKRGNMMAGPAAAGSLAGPPDRLNSSQSSSHLGLADTTLKVLASSAEMNSGVAGGP